MRTTKDFGLAAGFAIPCDVCGNETLFTALSEQVAEDLCELRVICRCGFDRAETLGRDGVESVMGELTQESIATAFYATWGARPLACSRSRKTRCLANEKGR